MPIIRKLTRFGHSIAATIPTEILKHLGLGRGDYIVWFVDKNNNVVVEKLTPKKHPGFFISGLSFLKRDRQK